MNRSRMSVVLNLAAALALLAAGPAVFTEEPGDEPGGTDMEATMQAYAELAKPGPHHEHLARLAGNWSYSVTFFDPAGGEPMETSGEIHADWILVGRFLHTEVEGEMMDNEFHGVSLDGYDTIADKYTAVWMDDMGTTRQ